jgi:hypothetical protein
LTFTTYLTSRHITTIRFEDISSIASGTFMSCSALTTIDLSSLAALTKINEHTFNNCVNLTSITLPNSITTLDSGALYGCNSLTFLRLPSDMFAEENNALIGPNAFGNCTNLKAIYLPADAVDCIKNINSNAFADCSTSGTI